ncbi:MAG: uroporphyrinogen-III synthase [Actinomycetota bacterium]|nr:uroporphyrinogen-III synthase [Actinomycetota bacterium]
MASSPNLGGFTVGVTADRRHDEQSLMLDRFGLTVLHAPTINTLPVANDAGLRKLTESLIADPPDYLVANTGLGIRGWFGLAATWGLDEALVGALRTTKVAARGPKAAGAAQIGGLTVWWRAGSEQLTSVGEHLCTEDLLGRRVVLQLHGDDRQDLSALLRSRGAEVIEVPVYRWTLPDDERPAERLIDLCCAGLVDAVTFTAGPAIRNLFEIAARHRQADQLAEAFNTGVLTACMGPVCARAAREAGVSDPSVPEHWRLGSLVRLVVEQLATRRRRFRCDDHVLAVQGSTIIVDDDVVVRLTERERAVLAQLMACSGGTVNRATLLGEVWHDRGMDAHVLETVVARLRSKLGAAGGAIETAVRRGYRFSAVELAADDAAAVPTGAE